MSEHSRRFGRWLGRKLRKLIGKDTTARRSFSPTEIRELLEQATELEEMNCFVRYHLREQTTSPSTLRRAFLWQRETLSALQQTVGMHQRSTASTTEPITPSKRAPKKVT